MGTYRSGGDSLIEKYANTKSFTSVSEFGRFLHEIDPSRSSEAWRLKIMRWRKKTGGEMKIDSPKVVRSMEVYYDKTSDCYISVIAGSNELMAVDGDTHRKMKRAYSAEGLNMKAHELAREFALPEDWVQNYIRVNGWTHGMDIFTDEEISIKSIADLVDEAVVEKRRNVLQEAKRKYWRTIERDADKYRLLRETLLNEFSELAIEPYKAPKLEKMKTAQYVDKDTNPYAVVISPTDFHYGKDAWEDETGETYNLETAQQRLMEQTQNLIDRLPGRPEKIIIGTGSDWFHVDNDMGTTTKGTPQDTAGSPALILRDGAYLARQHIEMLAKVAPVEVVFMRGNHDRHSSLALMIYLQAVYENSDRVTITDDLKLRQYTTYGNNLLGFTHGDGVRGADLPALMSHEARSEWGACEHHTWFHGHLHHIKQTEKAGCMVIQLPSLAGHDKWHYRKGFTLNRAGLMAHLVDKELGVIGNLFAPVE
tara:strand:- start:2408 stop:3847 length:1440 start_codon:yes stop_codon:yes gene_type:complete